MASRASEEKRARGREVLRAMRLGGIIFGSALALTAIIYISQRFERFLIRDPHFVLPGPGDYGQASPNLRIEGITYASRWQIQKVFERDFGRSVFLFPLAERRMELARVGWVKDSAIVRTWPNEITVRIQERRPVAYIQIPYGGVSRYALIDPEGVILEQPAKSSFDLPLLAGVHPSDPVPQRAERIRQMQSVLSALGQLANAVSEIDVGDPDDIKVRQPMDNRSVLLLLGDQNYAARMQTFFDQYPAIHKRAPGATTFDLRIDDRITAVTEGGSNVG